MFKKLYIMIQQVNSSSVRFFEKKAALAKKVSKTV